MTNSEAGRCEKNQYFLACEKLGHVCLQVYVCVYVTKLLHLSVFFYICINGVYMHIHMATTCVINK